MAKRKDFDITSLNGKRIPPPRLITGRPGEDVANMLDIPGVVGAINAYVCNFCYNLIIVQHVDKGLTPDYMACLVSKDCTGTARSMHYPPNPPQKVIDAVKWEWYRPTLDEFKQLDITLKQNVMAGALCIREKA